VLFDRRMDHWTLGFIKARGLLWYEERTNPDRPWLTLTANKFLEQWIQPSDRVVEFGSGRSTLWFAKHAGSVLSIEDN
jgi:hypothetical protein